MLLITENGKFYVVGNLIFKVNHIKQLVDVLKTPDILQRLTSNLLI